MGGRGSAGRSSSGYHAEAAALTRNLQAAPCPNCGHGAEAHTFTADAYDHAHAWCTSADGEARFTPRGTVKDQIYTAYETLVPVREGRVLLSRIRDALAHIPRAELDAALRDLDRARQGLTLKPELNQKAMDDKDRAAALTIAGDPKHLLQITAPPRPGP